LSISQWKIVWRTEGYAIVLVHADGRQVVFESGILKERAESMQAILLGFIADVRVVNQA